MVQGSCLCGAVAFDLARVSARAVACHCGQCRKQSGHLWASTLVAMADFRLTREDGLGWYDASAEATRGFCRLCGSFLFWKAHDEDAIAVAVGALDEGSGVQIEEHIFAADKGDYYTIHDTLPVRDR